MSKKYVGIDIGGTNLKAGVVDETGTLLSAAKTPLQFTTPEAFVETLAGLSRQAAEAAGIGAEEICAVGMGVPGEVDTEHGTILYTCNIPLADLPVGALFRRYLDVPVYLENDANCAALAEYWAGAGKGCHSLIVVTLGTGVGAGIVLGGKLLRGINGTAGETGHMVVEPDGVPCRCGRRGCWEQYASANALKRITREAMERCPDSALWVHCAGKLEQISGRSAFQVARECGDETAQAVCRSYVRYLALGVVNLINLFQPDVLCIGGGVSNEADEALLHPLQRIVQQERFGHDPRRTAKVVKAELGNDAGLIGAALLGRMETK